MKHAIVFTILFFIPFMVFAETIYVPDNHGSIQAAIDASVDGDTVIVRPGTYVENIIFNGKAITLQSEQGPEVTVIDGDRDGSVVVFRNSEGLDTVLDGFTIRDGSIGGIFCGAGVSPTITGNIVTDNYGEWGGGIECWEHSSPLIADNTITSNTADRSGGGIYCDDTSSPQISGNTIVDNSAEVGGGIFSISDATSLIANNTISGNSAGHGGGGIYCYVYSSPRISSNTITDNSAKFGGGIFCSAYSFPSMSDNIITDCMASDEGGGIYCHASSYPQISNSTIENNSAQYGGGIYCSVNSSPHICGSFVHGCSATVRGGGIYCCTNSTPLISNNFINENVGGSGGGIFCWNASPVIVDNRVIGNFSSTYAGGISLTGDSYRPPAMISGNTITNNTCLTDGGGIFLNYTRTAVLNNIIVGNSATNGYGGGIVCTSATDVLIANDTITGNSATLGGGGVAGVLGATITVVDTIFWGNNSPDGKEVSLAGNSFAKVSFCDVDGGLGSIHVEADSIFKQGKGMINAEPLFVSGSDGTYYLGLSSPCVDVGDPASMLVGGTTRTDQAMDAGVVDLGYHYPGRACLVAGPGPGHDNPSTVRVFRPEFMADIEFEFNAYDSSQYGVHVCCGDVDGDLHDEILTGAGPGETCRPHVRGFSCSGDPLPGLSFFAYNTIQYGVTVAAGDLDADGKDEIITGAGPGPMFGPHVRGWNYDGSGLVTSMANVNFFAYSTTKWGVNVSAGDIDGDGFDEIVTGAGPGAACGPHVRGWNVDGSRARAMGSVDFMAYGANQFGVNVACGDIDGDGIDEIVTGAGPGAVLGAHVRGWNCDGALVTPISNFSFFAWSPGEVRYGANVWSGADLIGNGRDEIVVGQGPDPSAGTWVKVYLYDGTEATEWITLEAFGDEGMTHGTYVAAGHF